jgi:hypothetical protein
VQQHSPFAIICSNVVDAAQTPSPHKQDPLMALEADPSSPVMSSLPSEIASTIQAGHINRHPDPARDITPSTAAEKKSPVTLHHIPRDELDGIDDDDDEDIPYSVLRPAPPAHQLPPLPDLRFEQSYLRSIAGADTWWKVLLITVRDQVRKTRSSRVLTDSVAHMV